MWVTPCLVNCFFKSFNYVINKFLWISIFYELFFQVCDFLFVDCISRSYEFFALFKNHSIKAIFHLISVIALKFKWHLYQFLFCVPLLLLFLLLLVSSFKFLCNNTNLITNSKWKRALILWFLNRAKNYSFNWYNFQTRNHKLKWKVQKNGYPMKFVGDVNERSIKNNKE